MKYTLLVILNLSLLIAGKKASGQEKISSNFDSIVFHSSRCFGICPEISLQINNAGDILLSRSVYLSKSEEDSTNSGNFKGRIPEEQLENLAAILDRTRYQKLHVKEVLCCDAPLRTIIIYSGGKRYYYRSMDFPPETDELIYFLRQLAITVKLPEYKGSIEIEQ